MYMNELYAYMKSALAYFDLRFCEMEEVGVSINGNQLIFRHHGRECSFQLPMKAIK